MLFLEINLSKNVLSSFRRQVEKFPTPPKHRQSVKNAAAASVRQISIRFHFSAAKDFRKMIRWTNDENDWRENLDRTLSAFCTTWSLHSLQTTVIFGCYM